MRKRLLLSSLFVSFALSSAAATYAAEREPFDQASFDAAQQRGARILIDISATWCPTCQAQKPIIDALANEPENKDLVIFAVDFDSQKPIVRELRAQSQSTLIAFHGARETGRSVGDTRLASILALVRSTVTQ
jgi:thioredoxin 1